MNEQGERLVFANGQWVPLPTEDAMTANQTRSGGGIPVAPGARIRQAGTNADTTGRNVNTGITVATAPATIQQAGADANKASTEAILSAQAAARGGVSQEKFDKDLGRYNTAQMLLKQLRQVEQQFQRDFRGGGIGQSLREYAPNFLSSKNQSFDRSANGLKPLLYALLPKTDSNPAAAQLVPYDQYVPQSGQFDATNADAIKRTRELAQGVLADTEYAVKAKNTGFQQAVQMLAKDPSPTRRQQFNEAAKKFGWPSTAEQILGRR